MFLENIIKYVIKILKEFWDTLYYQMFFLSKTYRKFNSTIGVPKKYQMSRIRAIQVQLGPPMVPKTKDAYKKKTKKNSSFVY